MIRTARLLPALVCPRCRAALERNGDQLGCQSCPGCYPVRDGVPDLRLQELASEEQSYLQGVRGALRRQPRLYRWLFRLFAPVLVTGPDGARRLAPLAEQGEVVLDIGAGNDRRHPQFCNVDLLPYPEVDLLADGETLPLADESVAGVICIVVLEHVPQPLKLLREIQRILQPGGRLVLAVPLLQPFHAAPHDYRRWTRGGLCREVEPGFQVRDAGVYCGPASALSWLLAEWCALVLSLGIPAVRQALALPLQVLCSPLKWLDVILARLPDAHRLASVVYIDAEKKRGQASA